METLFLQIVRNTFKVSNLDTVSLRSPDNLNFLETSALFAIEPQPHFDAESSSNDLLEPNLTFGFRFADQHRTRILPWKLGITFYLLLSSKLNKHSKFSFASY